MAKAILIVNAPKAGAETTEQQSGSIEFQEDKDFHPLETAYLGYDEAFDVFQRLEKRLDDLQTLYLHELTVTRNSSDVPNQFGITANMLRAVIIKTAALIRQIRIIIIEMHGGKNLVNPDCSGCILILT